MTTVNNKEKEMKLIVKTEIEKEFFEKEFWILKE